MILNATSPFAAAVACFRSIPVLPDRLSLNRLASRPLAWLVLITAGWGVHQRMTPLVLHGSNYSPSVTALRIRPGGSSIHIKVWGFNILTVTPHTTVCNLHESPDRSSLKFKSPT